MTFATGAFAETNMLVSKSRFPPKSVPAQPLEMLPKSQTIPTCCRPTSRNDARTLTFDKLTDCISIHKYVYRRLTHWMQRKRGICVTNICSIYVYVQILHAGLYRIAPARTCNLYRILNMPYGVPKHPSGNRPAWLHFLPCVFEYKSQAIKVIPSRGIVWYRYTQCFPDRIWYILETTRFYRRSRYDNTFPKRNVCTHYSNAISFAPHILHVCTRYNKLVKRAQCVVWQLESRYVSPMCSHHARVYLSFPRRRAFSSPNWMSENHKVDGSWIVPQT